MLIKKKKSVKSEDIKLKKKKLKPVTNNRKSLSNRNHCHLITSRQFHQEKSNKKTTIKEKYMRRRSTGRSPEDLRYILHGKKFVGTHTGF